MTDTRLSFASIPIAVNASDGAPPALPVSNAEAVALVQRIRRESRLPRLVAVGAAMGVVCDLLAIWPFITADRYVVNALVHPRDFALAGLLCSLALAGLLPLVTFYSLRLWVQSTPASVGAIEDNLRKIRRLVTACMALSIISLTAVLAQQRPDDSLRDLGLAVMYGACGAGCGLIVGDLRRGLGDYDSARQRARRRVARGFQVELRPAAGVRPILPLSESDGQGDIPFAAPAATTPYVGVEDDAGRLERRDLRAMLHALAAAGIALYAVLVADLPQLWNSMAQFNVTVAGVSPTPYSASPYGAAPTADPTLLLLGDATAILIRLFGAAWITWGVIVLCYGARWRNLALVVAWLTLVTIVVNVMTHVLIYSDLRDLARWQSNYRSTGGGIPLVPAAAELMHAALLCVLLRRPSMTPLFAVGSETTAAKQRGAPSASSHVQ